MVLSEYLTDEMSYGNGIMKRWMLDAIVGVGSLLVFLAFVLLLPKILPGEIGYLGALLIFVTVISAGGYAIRGVSN